MNNLIVAINGAGGVGKDTFVYLVREHLSKLNIVKVSCVSSVEAVKDAAKLLGWDGEKDGKGRLFLSDLKDMSTKNYDGPFKYIQERVDTICRNNKKLPNIIFVMVREPTEIRRLKDFYAPASCSVLIRRDGEFTNYGNHADDCVEDFRYDHFIENNGDLEHLKSLAIDYANKLAVGLAVPQPYKQEKQLKEM